MKYTIHFPLAILISLSVVGHQAMAQKENDDLYFSSKDRLKANYDQTSSTRSISTNNNTAQARYTAPGSTPVQPRTSNPDWSRYQRQSLEDNGDIVVQPRSNAPQEENVEYYDNNRYSRNADVNNWSSDFNSGNRFNPQMNAFAFNDPFFNPWGGFGMFRPAFFGGFPVYASPGLTVSLGFGFGGFGGFGFGGFGFGRPFGFHRPLFYDPFFGFGSPFFYDPFWGPSLAWGGGFGYGGFGYGGFGWGHPYGWGGFGHGYGLGYHHGFNNGFVAGSTIRSSYYGPRVGTRGSNFAGTRGGTTRNNTVSQGGNDGRSSSRASASQTRTSSYTRPDYATNRSSVGRSRTNSVALEQNAGTRGNYGSASPSRSTQSTGRTQAAGRTPAIGSDRMNDGNISSSRNQTPSYYRYDANSGYNNAPFTRSTPPNVTSPSRNSGSYSSPGRSPQGGYNQSAPSRQNNPGWSSPSQSPSRNQNWSSPSQSPSRGSNWSAPSQSPSRSSSPSWGGGGSSPSRGSYGGGGSSGGGGGGRAPSRGGR